MGVVEWITVFSVIALIAGWFINSWLNRRNEIAKERLKYRMDTLRSILTVLSEMEDSIKTKNGDISHLNNLMRDTVFKFYVYGEQDEIDLCRIFVKAVNEKNNIEFESSLNDLCELVKNKIRKELKLPPLNNYSLP